MKDNNVKSLQKLSAFCRFSGLASVFLGLLVTFIDVINQDWVSLQVGVFIFVSGYAFFKVGAKISSVLFDERTRVGEFFTK